MDIKDHIKIRLEQTFDKLLDKVDEVIDEAKDEGFLSSDSVSTIEACWKAMNAAKQVATACGITTI